MACRRRLQPFFSGARKPIRLIWRDAPARDGEALMTLFITHSACCEHLTPPGHPERPERLRAIEQVLEHEKFALLLREQCPRAELVIVALCHPWEYIERIRAAVPQIGLVQLDDDTVLSAGSFEASLRAAGGVILAVNEIMTAQTVWLPMSSRPVSQQPSRKNPVIGLIEQTSSRSPSTLRGALGRPPPSPLWSLSIGVSACGVVDRLLNLW